MTLNYPLLLLIFVSVYILQEITSRVVRVLNKSVEHFIEIKKNKKENVEEFTKNDNFEKEIEGFELIQGKKEYLGFITKIIGYFEVTFFIVLTVIILKYSPENYIYILSVAGAWIGLKIFGSYQQWSGVVLGRATFYIFLIGSIINIVGSIALGLIYYIYH